MAATRLALSMDEDVVRRARRLAEVRKTSISKLFVSLICILEQEEVRQEAGLPPLTKRALGLAKPKEALPGGDFYENVLCEALLEKYS